MIAPTIGGSVLQQDRQTGLRLIPPIEKFPTFVTFIQTRVGKLVLVLIFGLGFSSSTIRPWEGTLVTVTLGLTTFLPKWRRIFLASSAFAFSAIQDRSPYFIAVVVLGLLLFWCARRWPQSRFGKRPAAFLLTSYALLILATCAIPKSSSFFSSAWAAIGLLGSYVWFICYALKDRVASLPGDLPLEAGSFRPVWGSSNVPFPKGAAYLRRIEAHNAEQLAATQLKGLKLLIWALLLNLFLNLWRLCFHGYLRLPLAADALAMSVHRTPYPWYVCWESQLLSFFESVLELTIFGHRIIACCRMAGFNALRNTYRPLSSRTIVEFFNRFYYYFKELLVDFFFYPTFFRCFKRNRRLRLVGATFAAAAFGNMFYHFTRDYWMIPKVGLAGACMNFQVFAFYCLALASALSISQLRRRRAPYSGFIRGRLIPAVWVVLFYCVLDVFGSTQRDYSLTEHFRFLAQLFNIRY